MPRRDGWSSMFITNFMEYQDHNTMVSLSNTMQSATSLQSFTHGVHVYEFIAEHSRYNNIMPNDVIFGIGSRDVILETDLTDPLGIVGTDGWALIDGIVHHDNIKVNGDEVYPSWDVLVEYKRFTENQTLTNCFKIIIDMDKGVMSLMAHGIKLGVCFTGLNTINKPLHLIISTKIEKCKMTLRKISCNKILSFNSKFARYYPKFKVLKVKRNKIKNLQERKCHYEKLKIMRNGDDSFDETNLKYDHTDLLKCNELYINSSGMSGSSSNSDNDDNNSNNSLIDSEILSRPPKYNINSSNPLDFSEAEGYETNLDDTDPYITDDDFSLDSE